MLLLKFYIQHGQFPRGRNALPGEAVRFVADQVNVPASELGLYEWVGRMTAADQRGLTPLFWTHVAPYGEVRLDMNRRLRLD